MTIITRTNGEPFATEASARQQLTAKGLQGTHEVVPHEGGYALGPKSAKALKVGDMVRVNGHRARGGNHQFGTTETIRRWARENTDLRVKSLGANEVGVSDDEHNQSFHPSELDLVEQDDPITTLLAARKARDEAEQAYRKALEEAREYLGEGFRLAEVGVDWAAPDEDVTDPANWREGDVVECIFDCYSGYEKGGLYEVYAPLGGGRVGVIGDDGDQYEMRMAKNFRFHHRPK